MTLVEARAIVDEIERIVFSLEDQILRTTGIRPTETIIYVGGKQYYAMLMVFERVSIMRNTGREFAGRKLIRVSEQNYLHVAPSHDIIQKLIMR